MKFKVPDGMLMGDGAGGLWEVFAPRWWRLDRWLWWYVGRPLGELVARARGKAVTATGVVTVNGAAFRVVRSRVRLPRVP